MFQEYPPQQVKLGLSFGVETAILSQLRKIENLSDETFVEVIKKSYELAHPAEIVSNNLNFIVEKVSKRIVELQKGEKEPAETSSATKEAKSFGTSYAEWLSELNPTDACLYLADNNITEALHLYWMVDLKVVQAMLKTKSSEDNQKMLISMEACMYGFGGKYSEDENQTKENTVDIGSPEGKAALKNFGF